MREYLILQQSDFDERDFILQDIETGEKFQVDFYTDGKFESPVGVDETKESWKAWLKTFEGKIIKTTIAPYRYFTQGETLIINK